MFSIYVTSIYFNDIVDDSHQWCSKLKLVDDFLYFKYVHAVNACFNLLIGIKYLWSHDQPYNVTDLVVQFIIHSCEI